MLRMLRAYLARSTPSDKLQPGLRRRYLTAAPDHVLPSTASTLHAVLPSDKEILSFRPVNSRQTVPAILPVSAAPVFRTLRSGNSVSGGRSGARRVGNDLPEPFKGLERRVQAAQGRALMQTRTGLSAEGSTGLKTAGSSVAIGIQSNSSGSGGRTEGPDPFFAGLRAYLRQHQYGTTSAADLWAALASSSGDAPRPAAQG